MKKIGIICGSFHKDLIEGMLTEAEHTAREEGVEVAEVVWVPGSVEKPLAVQRMLKKGQVDGVVLLGIIERGETKHGLTMGQSLMHFVMQLSLDYSKPVTLGVLGPEILPDQVEPRLLPYARKAVKAAVSMMA